MLKCQFKIILVCSMVFASNILFSQGKVYFSDHFLDKIFMSNMDGSEVTPILQSSKIFYKKIDATEGKIYASDNGRGAVVRFDLDGTNEEILVSGLMDANGIAIDENSIYIVDGSSVHSYDKNGTLNAVLLEDLDYNVRGLEVHDGLLYIAGQKNFAGRIEKYTTDGAFVSRLFDDISSPIHMKIDGDADRIYWSQNTNSDVNSGLYSASLEGEDLVRHLDITIRGFDVDFESKDIYYTRSSTGFSLYFTNLDDLDNRELLVGNLFNPNSILIDKANSRIIVSLREFNRRLVSFDVVTGSNRQNLFETVVNNPENMSIDELNGHLYWINSNSGFQGDNTQSIMRSNLDGSNAVKLMTKDDGLDRPSDLLFNDQDGYLYWVDSRKNVLKRVDPNDVTNQEDVFSIEDADLICFDTDGVSGNFYVFDNESKTIIRKNVNTDEEVVILETNGNYVSNIEQGRDKLFLAGLVTGSIMTCDLDGSNLDTILTTENPVFHRPTGLSYDRKEDRLYFTISFSSEKVQSCEPDGSDVVTIVPDGLEAPDAIAVLGDNLSALSEEIREPLSLHVLPNPTSNNMIHITSSEPLREFTIYSSDGQILMQRDGGSLKNQIDISHLSSGMYHLRAFTKEGRMTSSSFVKI